MALTWGQATTVLAATLPALATGYFGYRAAHEKAAAGYEELIKTVDHLQKESETNRKLISDMQSSLMQPTAPKSHFYVPQRKLDAVPARK